MSTIPLKPQQGVNPGGPAYQHNTGNFVRKESREGNIDGVEGRILANQNNDIKGRVEWNKQQGLDPLGDPTLARMQVNHRAAANTFANFNPGEDPQGVRDQGNRQRGPVSFTDENGNEVTKTPDGYTSVKNADGTSTTLTPGGYEIKYDSENGTATLTDTKSGESSSIWGDPHVTESDGGQWDWQSGTSTYVLPDGTKITMNSSGGDESNGYGTLQSIDIYSGQGRTHVSSSADGTSLTGDSRYADAQQDDGDLYFGNLQANSWFQRQEMGAA